jgi:pimeloyl-ACP methyl ester carboxylesterase
MVARPAAGRQPRHTACLEIDRMTLDHHRTVIHGIEIAWKRHSAAHAPSQTPLVVLHGLGSSSSEFGYLADLPTLQDRDLFLIDLPGFGDSAGPDEWPYTMEAHADILATLIPTIASRPVVVVGHSMGGSIAIALAHHHPGIVPRLVVAEPGLDPGSGMLSAHIARQTEAAFVARGYLRLLYQTRREAERGSAVAGRFLVTLEQASPVALWRSAVSLLAERSPTLRQQLEGLAIPRTMIRGALTPPLDPPLADPEIAQVVIENAGHVMMTEQPAAFAAVVHRALSAP